MVTMSGVWDSTTEVLRGRSAILTRIALPALFVPAVIRDGITTMAGPVPGEAPKMTAVVIGGVVALIVGLVTIWGQLAIVAVASHPTTTQADAFAQATRRFGPALGIYAVAILVVLLATVPVGAAVAGAGFDWAALSRGQAPAVQPSGGLIGFILVYGLVLTVAGLIVAARLFVLNPVIVNEKVGLRAFARSWALTRGLTWRIIGVTILFAIVWVVAASAAQFVIGLVLRLALGPDAIRPVAFIIAVVSAAITTVYMVVVSSFAAQLYAARTQLGVADVFA